MICQGKVIVKCVNNCLYVCIMSQHMHSWSAIDILFFITLPLDVSTLVLHLQGAGIQYLLS
jgi:hypothetical protein